MVDLTPVDYLGGLGGLANLPNPARDMEIAQGLRTTQLQQQAAQLKLRQALTEQQEQQLFQRDVMTLGDNPTPQGIAALIRRYPKYAEQLKAAHDIQDEAKRTSDFRLQSQVYSAAANGRYDLAAQMLEDYANADIAAGGAADPMDQAIIEALRSDDPAEQKRALSMIGIAVAAINPKKFDDTYKALTGGGESYTLAPGAKRFDSANRLVASAPFAPMVRSLEAGKDIVQIDPNEGGGGGVAYTGGWTPRERHGGDNPDAAVDNKIAGVAAALGVAPDADISKLSPRKIAEALAFGEGGPGSLADRNNNPTNLRLPGSTEFRQFATKEAALNAAATQVARNLKRGQTTVQSMIEGLPVAGPGGVRVLATGGAKPGYQVLTADENRQLGLNPDVKYQRAPDGQITALGGQDTKTKAGRAIPQTAVDKLTKRIEARDSLGRSLSTFKNDFGGNTVTGSLENKLQGIFGTGTPGQRDWWANFYETDNQIRNDLFGSALTATEQAAYERTTITPSMQPSEIRANLKRRNAIIRKALDRQKKVLLANKYEPEAVEALFSDDPLEAPAQTQGGFRILGVRPK